MNSKGGYLFIGVSDGGEMLGIEEDLNILGKKSLDAFISAFYQVVADYIGKDFSQYVHAEMVVLKTKNVCCVRIDASPRPAWLIDGVNPTFFLRVGNSSRPLDAKAAHEYLLSRLN